MLGQNNALLCRSRGRAREVYNRMTGSYFSREIITPNAASLAIVAVYLVVGFLVLGSGRVHLNFGYANGLTMMLLYFLTVVFLYALRVMLLVRPKRLLKYYREDFPGIGSFAGRFLRGAPLILALPLFAGMFASWKMAIPELVGFSWDARLRDLDLLLHGGVQPWLLLQPILGHPVVTSFVNGVYGAWFFVMYFTFLYHAFSLDDQERNTFLISFFLVWIVVGSLMATAMASAGPCYFDRVVVGGTDGGYQALMTYHERLHEAGWFTPSVSVQEMLWRNYMRAGYMTAGGISAMPSMHVACTALIAASMWTYGLVWRVFGALFLALIMLGSVHLGWHYAVDAYVGVGVAIGIFLIVRAVLARRAGA